MPREFNRTDRIADAIQKELAQKIRAEMRDPRVGMVNVNAVEVSKDLSVAKIFVTFIDDPDEDSAQQRVAVLNKASGFLRRELGVAIRMRVLPQLRFIFDVTQYRAQHMSDLIDRAIAEDQAKHSDGTDNQ